MSLGPNITISSLREPVEIQFFDQPYRVDKISNPTNSRKVINIQITERKLGKEYTFLGVVKLLFRSQYNFAAFFHAHVISGILTCKWQSMYVFNRSCLEF